MNPLNSADPQVVRFRGSLGDRELQEVCTRVEAEPVSGFLFLWDLLLAKAGELPLDQRSDRSIRPDAYSIPFGQARTIVASIAADDPELHFAWLLAWMNHGPSWHHD